jgi:alpha-galactosidase
MSICAQGSFSDAHETLSIPIIAANLHRLILPRQSEIWAVLHADDTFRYLQYKLAATFLGRMCLSGEINDLSDDRLDEIRAAQDFYHAAAPVIRNGRSRLHREMGKSWNKPRGWQAVVRHNEQLALIVIHRFAGDDMGTIEIPLPLGAWRIHRSYGEAAELSPSATSLRVPDAPPFSACAVLLEPA